MFTFLKELDNRIYERYLTLERNIKSASNSFYDAYLDLQEEFVKYVMLNFEIGLTRPRETCGESLKREEVRKVFIDTLNVDDYTYSKMQDYTLKVNAHKHKGEKCIQIETVINYLRIIYNATTTFARYRGIEFADFEAEPYIDMLGQYERENKALQAEANSLKEELRISVEERKLKDSDIEKFQNILSQSQLDNLTLEDKNKELLAQISLLKDLKLSAMEEKLNKALDMLLELQSSVTENRAVSYAVGDTICGRERFDGYVRKAKEELKHE